jgi:hypothetical protein
MQKHKTLKDQWLQKLGNRLRLTNAAWKTEQSYVRSPLEAYSASMSVSEGER